MSPRRLMGWEPGEVTTFEYDDEGRVVRAITVREPEFSAWDVAVLLADRAETNVRRGKHGIPLSEALDPANQFAFEAKGPVTDWAQKALDDAEDDLRKRYPKANTNAVHFWVERRQAVSR